MEKIIKKHAVPMLPEVIKIQMASRGALPGQELQDISEAGIRDIVNKVRTGQYLSLMMVPGEENAEGYLMLESSDNLIFLQIWDEKTRTVWACFNPELLDSEEEFSIEHSDGQSLIPLKYTMQDRELAARCVEWYAYTCEPYPGMDWLKENSIL